MRSFAIFILTVFMFLMPVAAQADYHVWDDAESGITVSFPDTWRVSNNVQPDDVFTVAPPAAEGYAVCRIRVQDDRRFMMYPPKLSEEIQLVKYSTEYWEEYLNGFANPTIHIMRDNASLGKGVAGYVLASFDRDNPGPMMRRKAMIFATSYYDHLYILECSAAEHAFDRWRLSFLSLAKSVDFKKTHHELITGEYEDVLDDGLFAVHGYEAQGFFFY